MLRTIVRWAAVDSTDWKTTMRRMNGKLNAAPRLYPISPWSDAVFTKAKSFICACLSTSGSMASSSNFLESSWQCRSTFYKLTSSKTCTPIGAMGWQLTEIWWNAISTKNMVQSCSTHCLMVFFWKPVHTVLSWMHCKLMVLICLVSQFRVPPSVSWKDRDHWLGRAEKKNNNNTGRPQACRMNSHLIYIIHMISGRSKKICFLHYW